VSVTHDVSVVIDLVPNRGKSECNRARFPPILSTADIQKRVQEIERSQTGRRGAESEGGGRKGGEEMEKKEKVEKNKRENRKGKKEKFCSLVLSKHIFFLSLLAVRLSCPLHARLVLFFRQEVIPNAGGHLEHLRSDDALQEKLGCPELEVGMRHIGHHAAALPTRLQAKSTVYNQSPNKPMRGALGGFHRVAGQENGPVWLKLNKKGE